MTRRLLSLALAAAMAPTVIAGTVGCAWCIWVADVARAQRAKAAPVSAAGPFDDLMGIPILDAAYIAAFRADLGHVDCVADIAWGAEA